MKNQNIQEKINSMKEKIEKNKNKDNKRMRELKDLCKRSNNQSKLKLTFFNDKTSDKFVVWLMSRELMKYTLINGNEEVVMENDLYSNVLNKIDSMFIDYLDLIEINIENDKVLQSNINPSRTEEEFDFENIFINLEMYEDMNVDNCEVYKKNVIFKELNMVVAGIYLYQKINIDSEEEEDTIDTGDFKDNFYKLILKYMVSLEKIRIGNTYCCEDCEEELKEVSIKITGYENKDSCEILGIDLSKLRMSKTNLTGEEDREEQIKKFIDNVVDKKE